MALARDIHLGRLLGAGRAAARRAARGRPRLHLGPDSLLDRPGARPARLPARDARRHPLGRAVPAAWRAGRGSHRPRSRRGPETVRDRGRRRARRTPAPWTSIGELADVADAEDLWLHVDAAYGGAARLSARDGGRVPDLERADSVTVDPHKWFFQAYDIGGLLVRDGAHLAAGVRRPGARVLPRRRDARGRARRR